MTPLQKFILSLMPAAWAKEAEAHSREWHMCCGRCGHEQSVWDAGGIRWRAYGSPRWFRRCAGCGKRSWLKVVRKRGTT